MPRMLYVSGPTDTYPITSLAEYVRRIRNEKDLSLAPMCAGSRGQISKTHINRIENGTVTRVSLIKLRALALGLGIPEDNLITAAQGSYHRPTRRRTRRSCSVTFANSRSIA